MPILCCSMLNEQLNIDLNCLLIQIRTSLYDIIVVVITKCLQLKMNYLIEIDNVV